MLWQRTGLCHVCASLKHEGCQATGLNDNIRLYRYTAGQKFGRHVDDSVQLPGGRRTAYTLRVYLSGGGSKDDILVGGETVFYGDRGQRVHSVKPTCGKALLHLHGDMCLEHEGLVVRSGCRYVLRSDVVFGPSAT
jgi:2OG-Fe(II) oxygenase superfamily